MKKSNKLAFIGAGFAMAVASLGLATSPKMNYANRAVVIEQNQTANNTKALAAKVIANHRIVRENVGGLDLVQSGEYGMSPKEYGLRFGNGKSKKGKTNFNRMSHNAKLKRS